MSRPFLSCHLVNFEQAEPNTSRCFVRLRLLPSGAIRRFAVRFLTPSLAYLLGPTRPGFTLGGACFTLRGLRTGPCDRCRSNESCGGLEGESKF